MATGNIGKIKASRVNNVPNVDSYIGESGILFFNFANGVIRLSDGVTPGGLPIPYTVASTNTIGGIKAGPGANISADGTLTVDTAGLPLSIGNLSFEDTTISTLNPDVNLNLYTNGTGNINLVGAVNFYKPDGPLETRRPFFQANSDGQITILVPVEDPIAGGVEIVGSATGNTIQLGQPGAMLHLTGNPGTPTRFYADGNGNYVSITARRWNGNVAVPTQILAGDDVLRINSTAATNLNGGNVGNLAMAQIRMTALENQTPTAQGSTITFTVTPVGSSALSRVDVANVTVANGITATKFTTSGNVTAGSYVALAGSSNVAPLIFTSGTVLTTPATGAVEFDGNVFYGTPSDSQRGIIPTQQWFILNADRSMTFSNTVAQSLFGVSPRLAANTRYYFRIKAFTTRTTGDNNTSMHLAWGGNAGLSKISYSVQSKTGVLNTLGSENTVEYNITSNFSTNVAISATSNAPSSTTIIITGIVDTTTAGTLTPLITWSGATPAGSVTVTSGSNYDINPLSSTGANTQIGNWTSS